MSVSQNIQNTNTAKVDDIDFGKLFGSIIDARWFIIGVTLVFTLVGLSYALLATPVYKADSLIQVEQKQTGGISALVGNMGEVFAQDSSSSAEISIISSRMVLGKTVDELGLTTLVQPDYLPYVGAGLARLLGQQISAQVSVFELPQNAEIGAATVKVTGVDAKQPNKGRYQLLNSDGELILTGKTDVLATAEGYRLLITDFNAKAGDSFTLVKRSRFAAIQWLQANLAISEVGKQTGILRLTFTGTNQAEIKSVLNNISNNYLLQNVDRNAAEAEKSLAFLHKQLPQIKDQLTTYEDKLNAYRLKNDSVDLDLEAKSKLGLLIQLDGKLNDLVMKESELSQRFTKDHPNYIALVDKRKILESEKVKLEAQIQKLPETQRSVLRLMRDVQVTQQIYLQLLNKSQELTIVKAGTVGNVRVLDHAQVYPVPVKPTKALIVILWLVIGLMLSLTIVLGIALFKHRIDNPEQVEALGLSVYASIPLSDWQVKNEAKITKQKCKKQYSLQQTLLAVANPADLAIESLRSLRTSMHFAMLEAKNNIVVISGSAPNIGKSFVSTNLAAVISQSGQKVLVIDADMRKGYLQRSFALEWDNGLSEFLSGKLILNEVIKTSAINNLDVITRGQIPPNPSELLMHPRLQELLLWAAKEYDLVIVDTPPILAVTDAAIVGRLAGTTLIVGRFEQTALKEVEITKQRFEQNGIEVKGFILNAVERKASGYYGSYGYYQYGYTEDKA